MPKYRKSESQRAANRIRREKERALFEMTAARRTLRSKAQGQKPQPLSFNFAHLRRLA